jgi:ubiquinone/menaquinone biosynthesis C-methylase UbiE
VIDADVRAAYDATAGVWSEAPDRLYSALARPLLAALADRDGSVAVDVGAGSGAVTRGLSDQGWHVVAVDSSARMLAVNRSRTPCRVVVGDATALPLGPATADAVTLGFVLNHLAQPAVALGEAVRVVRPGGLVLATTWSRKQDHPAREVVEAGLVQRGYVRPAWYSALKQDRFPLTDTDQGLRAVSDGLDASVEEHRVDVPLTARDLVAWRLGMAQHGPFVAALPAQERAVLVDELVAACTGLPPLQCQVLLLRAAVA